MTDLILRNLRLLDLRGGRISADTEILIRDDIVVDVSPHCTASQGSKVIDLGGRIVMPGLIDCHVHIMASHTAFGLQASRQIPHSLVTAHASRHLRNMLMRGFTTVRDAGGADFGHKLAVEQGLFVGPRLFISGRAISQTGGHGDFRERVDQPMPCACAHMLNGIGRIADGISEVRRAARDEIRLGADQIKVMASGGVASAADPVHFQQYSSEELEAFVDEARRAGTYVMAHAYTSDAVQRAVDAGVRTIEHGNLIDAETANLMARRGTYLVPTLATYFTLAKHGRELGFPEGSLAKLTDIVAVGTRSLKIAAKAGVKIAFGTDLLGQLQEYQTDEFRIRSEVQSPEELLASATVIGAEILGMVDRLGVIARGAYADLLAVDGNPLEDISVLAGQGENLALIVKGGRIEKDLVS